MKEWNSKIIHNEEDFENDTILDSLVSAEIPAVITKNFYSKEDCQKITFNTSNFSKHIHGETYSKKIGIFLSAYQNNKQEYFVDAIKSNNELDSIFEGRNPVRDIHKKIIKIFNLRMITTAIEGKKKYSRGIIRLWELGDVGPLHRDNASFEAPDFKISKYENQFSCVLYLQEPENGGELVIHRQKWEKSDEKFREIGFGYTRNVLKQNVENSTITPEQGDLIIFNPKFFHEILPVAGDKRRITFGNFFGLDAVNKTAESWS